MRLLVIFLSLLFSLSPCFGKTTKIKFATVAPEGTAWMKAMHSLNKDLQKKTNKKIKFIFYPGGVAGDEKDILRKMRFGKIHSTGVTGLGMGQILSDTRVLDLPILFKNDEDVDKVHAKLFEYFSNKFREKGFELLAWSEVGWTYLFSQLDLSDFENYKKLKMWTWEGDPLAIETFKALNISPIPLSVANVLTSLETGLLDSVYSPPLAAIALQWNTKVKYMLKIPVVHSSGALLITSKQFKKLSNEQQIILKDLSQKAMSKLTQTSRIENEKALESMVKDGLIIVEPKEEHLNFLHDASQNVKQSLIGSLYTEETYKLVKEALKA